MTENYLNLVANQIENYFEKDKNNKNLGEFTLKSNKMLAKLIRNKDELLMEQLKLIEILVTKLFVIDRRLQFLEKRVLSVTSFLNGKCFEEKLEKVETENRCLKDTLLTDKSHIEQLDKQFETFLREREELKKRNKSFEKKTKNLCREKEEMACKCASLREKNKQLENEIQTTKSQLELANNESINYKEKLRKIKEENRKSIEEIALLNKENYSLSYSISVLRDRSEYTCNFTNEEIGKMNVTVEELRTTLEKTKIAQEEEEQAHEEEIATLNDTICNLQQQMQLFFKENNNQKICKICRGKSKVGFVESSEIQVNLDTNDSSLEKIINDRKMTSEIDKRNSEIESLKAKISELTAALNSCEERAANLQEAVALYSNSIAVLETSRNEAKCQIDNQKVTIGQLQRALVEAKNDVDVWRKKSAEDHVATEDQDESEFYRKMAENLHNDYEKLQNLNFDLEVEHFDSLRDVDNLEHQLNKIKLLLRLNEEQLKKVVKQKKCYEEVIDFFKKEMGLMAAQLEDLQQVLTLSNETAHEESTKMTLKLQEVQSQNELLTSQLNSAEKKLHQLIDDKEAELRQHNLTVSNIRQTLNESTKTNENLQKTVQHLNATVNELQGDLKRYEEENFASKRSCQQFQLQIGDYCDKLTTLQRNLEEKTAETLKLEMAYNNEKRQLHSVQRQLHDTEKLVQQSENSLVESLDEFKQKLTLSDENNAKLCAECDNLQSQIANLTRKEAVKDLEIKRYRKIVGDLKSTMMELNTELNKNLAQKELKGCKMPNCRKRIEKDDPKNLDVCLTCPCEVEFYQKMVENLKNSLTDLKTQLKEAQDSNHKKDDEIVDLKRSKDEMNRKLVELQNENKKIAELQREIDQLSQELRVRSMQLTDVKKSANEINSSKCVQLACAQEEIGTLKNELSNYLNKQYLLKKENEQLQTELTQLNGALCCCDDKIKTLKEQIDQNLCRIKNLTAEKEAAQRKNRELLQELRSMTADKQKQRSTIDSLKLLKSDKEEICSESMNVIKNVRAWVMEQKRINSFVVQRELQFFANNDEDNREIDGPIPKPQTPPLESSGCKCRANKKPTTCAAGKRAPTCASPCSLGSQGRGGATGSFYDDVSPPPSPDFGSGNEWYSTNFQTQTESEADSADEDYCVNALEQLTEQMRQSNRAWMDDKCRLTVDRRAPSKHK